MALNSNLTPIVPSEHLGKVWRVPCVPCAGISMPTECATASVMVLVAETKTMFRGRQIEGWWHPPKLNGQKSVGCALITDEQSFGSIP